MKNFSHILKFSKNNFSQKISDKEKKINQFFKLPKHKLEFSDKVFDRPEEEDSVLKTLNESDIDKIDMYDKVIKKKKLESERKINKFFSNLTPIETIKITENLVEKLRLNREFKFTNEYKEKEIMNEYGNYDKYFNNYKVVKEKEYDSNDDGESVWEMKYNELQEKFKNPSTKDEISAKNKNIEDKIAGDLHNYGTEFTFPDYLNMKRKEKLFSANNISSSNPRASAIEEIEQIRHNVGSKPLMEEETQDIRSKVEKDRENKKKMFENAQREIERAGFEDTENSEFDNPEENIITGRVSPWCKEEIYRNYLEGWTVKDLSYKYGLLPERVKAIVYMRDLFWKEIYPKIGESGLRRRLEQGAEYAKKFAYIDYGKDIQLMAEREQGIRLRKITRGEIDCKPTKQVEEKVSAVLKNLKPKSVVHIPLKFYGKGASGYLIKNMVCNRGNGSKRVSFMFQKFCRYKDLQPNLLPEKLIKKKDLPPRLATLGYRF